MLRDLDRIRVELGWVLEGQPAMAGEYLSKVVLTALDPGD